MSLLSANYQQYAWPDPISQDITYEWRMSGTCSLIGLPKCNPALRPEGTTNFNLPRTFPK